jgi:hypothetical protein
VSEKEILYSAANQAGIHYEEAKPQEDPPYTMSDYKIDLYEKVGAWYGWSWKEFIETPLPVIKELESRIDFQIENFEIVPYLHPQMLFVMLAIIKALGGSSK